MRLILVRGLPGSGKTTFAIRIAAIWCEADHFFTKDGVYSFDPTKLKEAHAQCLSQAQQALAAGHDVVVANTFTRIWEMQKYLDLARDRGATVTVYKTIGEYANVHGVPPEVVERMRSRWEDYPGELLAKENADDHKSNS